MDKLQPGEIYSAAVMALPARDIDHHNSDLYLRCSPASAALVERLSTKVLLTTFRDYNGIQWFELPFCFTPFWENPAKYY